MPLNELEIDILALNAARLDYSFYRQITDITGFKQVRLDRSRRSVGKEPTRVALTTSALINHIATSCIGNILEAVVHEIARSDHFLIFCMRKLNALNSGGYKTIRTRNMKTSMKKQPWVMLQKPLWKCFCVADNIGSMVEVWSYFFSSIIEKHTPIKALIHGQIFDLKSDHIMRDKIS